MPKFLPGHPRYGGRKKGKKSLGDKLCPKTIREFLESKKWNPLEEVHALMPKLSEYQQARINMELIAMDQKERLASPTPPNPDSGTEEAKRFANMDAAAFVESLPVKLNGTNGTNGHGPATPGANS